MTTVKAVCPLHGDCATMTYTFGRKLLRRCSYELNPCHLILPHITTMKMVASVTTFSSINVGYECPG